MEWLLSRNACGRHGSRRSACIVVLLLLNAFLASCAGSGTTPPRQKEKPFKDWKLMAEPPQPQPQPAEDAGDKKNDLPEIVKPEPKPVAQSVKPERPLPTQKVSLRMHNADVVVVLRALARAVNQSILINDKVKGAVSVDIENQPWGQAFEGILRLQGLAYTREGELLRVMTVADMENDLKMKEIQGKTVDLAVKQQATEPLVVQVVPIEYADAGKLQEKLKDYLTKDDKGPRGSISVDDHTNALMINASRDDVTRLVSLVKQLDKPTDQVMIQSTIVEATKETARNLGIQWGGFYKAGNTYITPGGLNGKYDSTTGAWTYTPITGGGVNNTNTSNGSSSSSSSTTTTDTGIGGQGFGVNFPVDVSTAGGAALGLMFGTLGGNILDVQLSALETKGQVNILSSPSITTLDNQTAFTENGEKVPYVSTSQLSGTEVKFEDAVLRLEITPHVISGTNRLRMKIVVKKDEVDSTRSVQGNPYIIKKQTQTTLICDDGQTIVISGLTKETKSNVKNGVPGLQNTPVLGRLFGNTSKEKKMEEVLIFITPYIMKASVVHSMAQPGGKAAGAPAPRNPVPGGKSPR